MQLQVIIDTTEYPISFQEEIPNKRWVGTIPNSEFVDLRVVVIQDDENFSFEEIDTRVDKEASDLLRQFSDYLDHEKVQEFRSEQDGIESTHDDDDLETKEKPYDPTKIRVDTKTFSIHLIYEMLTKYKTIDLSPDFQRNFVWNTARKSQLIESILLGIPLPVFYFSQDNEGVFHVVDGLQRITSISDFLNNKFTLSKLEYLDHLNGKYFDKKNRDSLEDRLVGRILQTNLICNIIDSSSPSQVKYDIFRRINTGGQPLNHQEIRNCLAFNQTRKLLREMAHSESFLEATLRGVKDKRMAAQELALRFAGFWMVYVTPDEKPKRKYSGDMIDFLDDTIEFLNQLPKETLNRIKEDFINAMKNARYLFGDYAFRKILPEHIKPESRKQLINKVLFLTWSLVLCKINHQELKTTEKLQEGCLINPIADELGKQKEYYTRVTQGTNAVKNIQYAYEMANQILNQKNDRSKDELSYSKL